MIRVQRDDFDIGAELDRLAAGKTGIGGVACFVGVVRDFTDEYGERARPSAPSPSSIIPA